MTFEVNGVPLLHSMTAGIPKHGISLASTVFSLPHGKAFRKSINYHVQDNELWLIAFCFFVCAQASNINTELFLTFAMQFD